MELFSFNFGFSFLSKSYVSLFLNLNTLIQMAPALWQLNEAAIGDIGDSPVVSVPLRQIKSRHTPCPPTDSVSPPSQEHSLGVPCPVGRGPAGTISHGIQGSPGIWEEAMETASRVQRGPHLLDTFSFMGVYFAGVLLFLFLSRFFLRGGRNLRRTLEQMRPDPDAPWQATWDVLQDDAPSPFRAYAPTRWEEDTHTLCGEEEKKKDILTLCGENDAPGQAGIDIEPGVKGESNGDRWRWYPCPASSSSGKFTEREGRR